MNIYEFYFWCGMILSSLSIFLMAVTKSLDIRGILGLAWGIFLLFYTTGKF